MDTTTSIEQLNSFLRGEIAAVETYRRALEHVRDEARAEALRRCLESHEYKVQTLRDLVERLGGTPAAASGMWGAFAKLVESGAATLGEKAALAALAEEEELGLRDYHSGLAKLDDQSRHVVESDLLAKQQHSLDTIASLRQSLG